MVVASLGAGRHVKTHKQFDTIRKLRTSFLIKSELVGRLTQTQSLYRMRKESRTNGFVGTRVGRCGSTDLQWVVASGWVRIGDQIKPSALS